MRVRPPDALDDRAVPFVSVTPLGEDRCRIFEFCVLCRGAESATHVRTHDEIADAVCRQAMRDVRQDPMEGFGACNQPPVLPQDPKVEIEVRFL